MQEIDAKQIVKKLIEFFDKSTNYQKFCKNQALGEGDHCQSKVGKTYFNGKVTSATCPQHPFGSLSNTFSSLGRRWDPKTVIWVKTRFGTSV